MTANHAQKNGIHQTMTTTFKESIVRKHSLSPIPLIWFKVGDLEQIHLYDDMTIDSTGSYINPPGTLSSTSWLKVNGNNIELWRRTTSKAHSWTNPNGEVHHYEARDTGDRLFRPFAVFEPTEYGWEAALEFHKYMDKNFMKRVCDRDMEYRKAHPYPGE